MRTTTKLWVGIIALAALSPIGLILPELFKAGAAWGEWGPEEIQRLIGYAPDGLLKGAGLWSSPIPDYAFKGWEEKGLVHLSAAYIASAALGIALAVGLAMLLGKALARKGD